jgi:hypothetical protein
MPDKSKIFRTLGIIIFSIGILAGTVLFILMNWANFEAYFYFGYTAPADEKLTSLRCPLLMTTSESSAVTISLSNNTNRDVSPSINIDISYLDTMRSERNNYPLAAGETRTLSWTVTPQDMVFGHLIMARVYVFSTYTLPSRANTCGTVVVNLPGLTGLELFVMLFGFNLVCMAVGWGLWLVSARPFQLDGLITMRAMAFFTVIVSLGILAGCIGWWPLGLICTAIIVLLLITVVGYYVQKA